MPETIIKVKSFECKTCGFNLNLPSGVEPTQDVCNLIFNGGNGDREFLQRTKGHILEAWKCPNCLIKGQDNQLEVSYDRRTETIVGIEDVENELAERDETIHRQRRIQELDNRDKIVNGFSVKLTNEEKQNEIPKIDEKIDYLKRQGFFLTTYAEKDQYRIKRLKDIDDAIIEVRKLE